MMRYGQIGLAALMLGAIGCATRGNAELLESQLRRQEDQLYALSSQLHQVESDLTVAKREVETLRGRLAERGESILLPEQSRALFRVAGVRIQKLLTGGLDRDGLPGDDVLNVVIVPHDEQGETVKLPGELEIEAIDLTAPEGSRQLGVWRFTPEEVADHWQTGLTSGFQFRIPWQVPPSSDDVVLHARYHTADGRQFGTSAEVRVIPLPEYLAKQYRPMKTQASVPGSPEPPAPRIFPSPPRDSERPPVHTISEHDPKANRPLIPSGVTPETPGAREFVPVPPGEGPGLKLEGTLLPAPEIIPAPNPGGDAQRLLPGTATANPTATVNQSASLESIGNASVQSMPETPMDQPPGDLIWTTLGERATGNASPKMTAEQQARLGMDEMPQRYRRTNHSPLPQVVPSDSSNQKPPW